MARARTPGTSSRIQASLVAEKYGSSSSPVRLTSSTAAGSLPSTRQRSAVRRSCQTMARCTGFPVARSHTTTVSRCTAMPMPATSLAAQLGVGERLARARDGGGEDLVGVVLHPAVGGEVLTERLLHLCEHGAVVGEDHGAGARGAGVEREDGHGADRGVRPRRADGWMGWGQRAPKMRARAKAGKPT